jgi:hypothetical protein
MVEGDKALANDQFEKAENLYWKAAGRLGRVVGDLEAAERDVQGRIRPEGAEETAPPVAVDAPPRDTNRFYIDTLRGYREALALAIVLRSQALQRTGEAVYRGAAQHVLDGDKAYTQQQFALALTHYNDAGRAFRHSGVLFGDTSSFARAKMAEADHLADVAPPGTWPLVGQSNRLAAIRTIQADAYETAAGQRMSLAGHIVEAYKENDPGDIPDVEVQPLPSLPPEAQRGVIPPAVPPVALGRHMPRPPQ